MSKKQYIQWLRDEIRIAVSQGKSAEKISNLKLRLQEVTATHEIPEPAPEARTQQNILEVVSRLQAKSIKKDEVYSKLIAVFNLLVNIKSTDNLPVEDMANILKYFEPTVSARAKKDPFAWVGQAVGTGDSGPNKYFDALCNIFIDDKNIVATDGRRLHILPNTDGMAGGQYDINKILLEDQPQYPDYNDVIPDIKAQGYKFIILKKSDVVITRVVKDWNGTKKICEIEGIPFNVKYLLEIMSMNDKAVMYINTEVPTSPAMIEFNDGRRALIMPMKLKEDM